MKSFLLMYSEIRENCQCDVCVMAQMVDFFYTMLSCNFDVMQILVNSLGWRFNCRDRSIHLLDLPAKKVMNVFFVFLEKRNIQYTYVLQVTFIPNCNEVWFFKFRKYFIMSVYLLIKVLKLAKMGKLHISFWQVFWQAKHNIFCEKPYSIGIIIFWDYYQRHMTKTFIMHMLHTHICGSNNSWSSVVVWYFRKLDKYVVIWPRPHGANHVQFSGLVPKQKK